MNTIDILAAIDTAIGDSSVGPDAMRCNAAMATPLAVQVRAEITTDDGALFTPDEWCRITGTRILDADGWRGRNAKPWDEPITLAEFRERASRSTQEMRAYRPPIEPLRETGHAAAWRMVADAYEED